MKKIKIFFSLNCAVLVTLGTYCFATHNVADAIFYMVVAMFIDQKLTTTDRKMGTWRKRIE